MGTALRNGDTSTPRSVHHRGKATTAMAFTDGTKYEGKLCAVGAFDTLNGKPVLRVNVKSEEGVLAGVLWLDATDGKTVNGNKLPSSLQRAKELCQYLTGKPFSPDSVPLMARSDKSITFTASKRITDSGNTVFDARFIGVPQGLAAFNAPSAATLAALFGVPVEASAAALAGDKPRDFKRAENPDAEPPSDDEMPF